MLELSSSGSVRGVPSNGHPYRDHSCMVVSDLEVSIPMESRWQPKTPPTVKLRRGSW